MSLHLYISSRAPSWTSIQFLFRVGILVLKLYFSPISFLPLLKVFFKSLGKKKLYEMNYKTFAFSGG